ncbi:MAG: T9SS type A sorting domain-containing protein [Calditrichales bacterium]|nr:MAG: T9SS type A sorting domain-containing protein [Calditrichales bacterium]
MIDLYAMLSGVPYGGTAMGGNYRFDEAKMATNPDPWTVHNDGGGTNLWFNYGPFDLAPGESVIFVEAEGVSGLSRPMSELIGRRWKKAYDDPNDKGPFTMPDGTTTTDKDVYKDAWFYSGKDSIMLTFSRAKRNYDLGFNIPQAPQPPPLFEINSGGDKINLKWSASPSEGESDFAGYKVYRAVGRADTVFTEIFACGKGTASPQLVYSFDDYNAIRGFSYYYYIVAFNDGSTNNTNANPHGSLQSSKYYTRTTEPAYLRRPSEDDMTKIRIVPNPYYLEAKNLDFPSEPDKIMFYNIPGRCTIRIFTERGDLIKTIEHNDGSGDQAWSSITESRQVVVSGVYIAHIQKEDGAAITKKFIIIR